MEGLIASLLAGAIIPAIAILIKKCVIDQAFKKYNREIIIESSTGKSRKYLFSGDIDEREILKAINSEIVFENLVRRSIENYIKKHDGDNLKIINDLSADFVLEKEGKKIAIEAKSDLNNFKANWAKDYLDVNSDINEVLIVVNSIISDEIKAGIEREIGGSRAKFIVSPNGRKLNQSLENHFNTEFNFKKA